ncbi:uncharacterized protein LOC130623561 [Hydractinia symbiolongicarpus]|uniref:uncharacterized protein LOC130623561 n=1 Tax=Hydractinia symbiolongicarpus TaxID=13093 RepID=UPI002549DEC5|nr:uncharacterized protein LOC130623561 [Hydractinia symbiolongicarpus]
MVKWFCSSSLCYNNFRTQNSNGGKLIFYRLPRTKDLQMEYQKIIKTAGVNWKNGHICCKHWSAGYKINETLPDVTVPQSQIPIIEQKYNRAKERLEKTQSAANKMKVKELKKKFKFIQTFRTPSSVKRKPPAKRIYSTPVHKQREPSKRQLSAKLISKDKIIEELKKK